MNFKSYESWNIVLCITICLYFIFALTIGLSYYWGNMSTLEDLGTYDQAVWGTLNGNFFLNTNLHTRAINFLGHHFQPILFIFMPFYLLAPRAEWLIIAQCVALSISAWPVFSIARHLGCSGAYSFLWVVIFLFNPFVLSVHPWLFHPVSLCVPFVLTAFLAIEKRKFLLFLFSCLFILFCKEHLGFMVVGLGILWGLKNRNLKQAMSVCVVGAICSVAVLSVIMPALSPAGKHVMFAGGLGQLSRYKWLGGSLMEIFSTLIFHPLYVVSTLFKMGSFFYMVLLLAFFAGLPLAAPAVILAALPGIMANALSMNPMPRGIPAYHSIGIIPVLTVSAMYGARRIARVNRKFTVKELTHFVVIATLIGGYYFAPLPLPGSLNYWNPVSFFNKPDAVLPLIKKGLGPEVSASAQENIGAHFSQRKEIYQFPEKVGSVDAVILRLESPTNNIKIRDVPIERLKCMTGSLDAHLQMYRFDYLDSIADLLHSSEYKIHVWDDPWLIFSKTLSAQENVSLEQIEQKLKFLRNQWEEVAGRLPD